MTSKPQIVALGKKASWPGFLALALVAIFAVRYLATWPVLLRYPGEENHTEGIPLAEMTLLRRGYAIYAPISAGTFHAANYGPLYFLLGEKLIDPEAPAYFRLRIVSLIATLACAAGCGILGFWLSRRWLAVVLGPLLFLSFPFVTRHGLSARSDLGALFLSFSGFLVAFRFRNSRRLLLSVPLLVAAFFYKQQFVAAPLAVLLFLVLERRTRLAGEFVALTAVLGTFLLGFFQFVVFRGQAFVHHFLFLNIWPFAWERVAASVWFFGLLLLFPLILVAKYLRQHPQRLLGCYLGFAIALNVVPFWRIGSDTNYFIETFAILCSLTAALFARGIADVVQGAKSLAFLACALLLSLGTTHAVPQPRDFARDGAIQHFLRSSVPPQATALGFYAGDLLRAGLETPITDLYAYNETRKMGRIPEQGLKEQFRQRRFGVVITYFHLRSPGEGVRPDQVLIESARQELLENYELAATLELPAPEVIDPENRFYAWTPRDSDAGDKAQGSKMGLHGDAR